MVQFELQGAVDLSPRADFGHEKDGLVDFEKDPICPDTRASLGGRGQYLR